MISLSNNWITTGVIDFEYKKYQLLGYLKDVETNFNNEKLYPSFADLIQQHRQLLHVRHYMEANDYEKLSFFCAKPKTKKELNEIEAIIEFALPTIESEIKNGIDLYEAVKRKIEVVAVDSNSCNQSCGYFLINDYAKETALLYNYNFGDFKNCCSKRCRTIKTDFVKSYKINATQLQENPNFIIEFNEKIPYRETLLPVAKRNLTQFIAAAQSV